MARQRSAPAFHKSLHRLAAVLSLTGFTTAALSVSGARAAVFVEHGVTIGTEKEPPRASSELNGSIDTANTIDQPMLHTALGAVVESEESAEGFDSVEAKESVESSEAQESQAQESQAQESEAQESQAEGLEHPAPSLPQNSQSASLPSVPTPSSLFPHLATGTRTAVVVERDARVVRVFKVGPRKGVLAETARYPLNELPASLAQRGDALFVALEVDGRRGVVRAWDTTNTLGLAGRGESLVASPDSRSVLPLSSPNARALAQHIQPGRTLIAIVGALRTEQEQEKVSATLSASTSGTGAQSEITPPAQAPGQAPGQAPAQAPSLAPSEVLARIESWRADWQYVRLDAYASHYADSFFSRGVGKATWTTRAALRGRGKAAAKREVVLEAPQIAQLGGKTLVVFAQVYRTDRRSNSTIKSLTLDPQSLLIEAERWIETRRKKIPAASQRLRLARRPQQRAQ
jgi:hypothetical protein